MEKDTLMKTPHHLFRQTLWIFLALCVLAPAAHAYLDPGGGSMMIQLLLAGVAGIGVALKVYWRRLRAFFGKSQDKNRKMDKPSS
jgi:hypothetical protein